METDLAAAVFAGSTLRLAAPLLLAATGELVSERAGAWCAERTTAEALLALEEARVPAGPVLSPQEALDDPHVQAMDILNPIEYPGLPKAAPVVGTPVVLSETPGRITGRPPQLGEHTDAILGELGYGASEISTLREQRVI